MDGSRQRDSSSTLQLERICNNELDGSRQRDGSNMLQLEWICNNESPKFPELVLTLAYALHGNKPMMVVTQRGLAHLPPLGFMSHVQVMIQEDGRYKVLVLLEEVENGFLSNPQEVHELLKRFSKTTPYKFCPGIEWTYYQEHYFEVIRFHIKSVRYTESPFYRVESVHCNRLFTLPSNAPVADKCKTEVICSACKRLISHLDRQLERTISESPERKIKRQASSSRARLTYMSPGSQLKRKQNASMERGIDKRKLAKYESTEITLSDHQHAQMCDVMNTIDGVAVDELQYIFEEGEAHGVSEKLKEIWTTDKREQLEQFKDDQARNGRE